MSTRATAYTYPFGTPLTSRPPSANTQRSVFVLGAYPSALHVRWSPPPNAGRLVAAIPIADEPSPFWDGADARQRVNQWMADLGDPARQWGSFSIPPNLNGPSGQWVDDSLLRPLGINRDEAWITDCLDTYRISTGVEKRLRETYDSNSGKYGWPPYNIGTHPSESKIVHEARAFHIDRLRGELVTCEPELIVTLGNAAARVMAALLGDGPSAISIDGYGAPIHKRVEGRALDWLPLAHPAAPKPYQDAHKAWVKQGHRP